MPELDDGSGPGDPIQLAKTGFAVGGPIGAAAFGGFGLLSGALGGGQRRRKERRIRQRNEKLLAMLQANVDRLGGLTASSTAEFASGRGELEDTIGRQAQRDVGSAAARGLTGSGFEIAQGANRARALGRGTASLLATSETRLSLDRRAAANRLLQGFSIAGQTDLALLQASDQRAAATSQAISSGVQAAATSGLIGRPAQAPTLGQSPFIASIQQPQQLPAAAPINNPFLTA